MTTESFSLIDSPWIPCEMADGSEDKLSIRQIFDGSTNPISILGESPAQSYAILRVLLAIFWRSHQHNFDEFEFSTWFEEQRELTEEADDQVLEYLAKYEDRFDLLHPEQPFMQVATLHTEKNTTSEIQRIIPEAESPYFTMRAGSGRESLAYDEAARWLIYTQAFDYSGIKSGAVGDPRVKGGKGYPIGTGWAGFTGATVIKGQTLRETLLLNSTSTVLTTPSDHPVWERQPDTAEQRVSATAKGINPLGAADLATWQSRRIRLFSNNGVIDRVLVSNGDQIPEAGKNVYGDPMTPYRYSKNQSKKDHDAYYPFPYSQERTLWRSLEPLIALEGDINYGAKEKSPIRPKTLDQINNLKTDDVDLPEHLNIELITVVYGPQASSVAANIYQTVEIPTEVFDQSSVQQRRAIINAAEATRNSAIALGSFAGQLLVDAGGEYAFQSTPTDTLLSALEPEFGTWLASLSSDRLEQQQFQWQTVVKQHVLLAAERLLEGAGPKAMIGREVEDANGNSRLHCAGTSFLWLQKQLKKTLPLLTKPEEVPHPKESKE